MGVIQKQSTYSTIFSYIGVALGFLSSAVLLPNFLSTEQVGFFKLIIAIVGVFSTIFSLGISQLMFRTFPRYDQEKSMRRKLLLLAIIVALIGSLIAFPVYYLTAENLFNFDTQVDGIVKNEMLMAFIFFAISAQIIYIAIYSYVRMLNDIVIDSFIQNIFLKGGVLVLLIFYYFAFLNYSELIYIQLILLMFFPFLITIVYYFKKDSLRLKHLVNKDVDSRFTKEDKKEFVKLLFFGLSTTLGGSLYLYLDTLMVNFFLTEREVGIYSTMFLFGMIVIIPARGLKSISVSILSRSFNENDRSNIKEVYQKSSITLLIIGGYIFLGVWSNMYAVLSFLPEDYAVGYYIVLFIGIAQLFDMLTGVNNEMIAASPHYKLNTLFTIISIIIGIILNFILIPYLGINGAGIATMITVLSVNLIRLRAVWKYFEMHPFTIGTLKIMILIIAMAFCIKLLPQIDNYLLDFLVRGGIISIIYIPTVYMLKVSNDINNALRQVISRFVKLN